MELIDDLGYPIRLTHRPNRICSLVPSLTEGIAVTTADRLIAATDWCTHPAELDAPLLARVRGTKNPDVARIIELGCDLVVANQEENRELDVRRLRAAGVPVWVTRIDSLAEAFASLRRLFVQALDVDLPKWLLQAEQAWQEPAEIVATAVVPVWKTPWMVVGAGTFTADLVNHLGFRVLAQFSGRYPRVELAELRALNPDVVLLPDEPYKFGVDDGPVDFPGVLSVCVPGRLLTWYGPSLTTARAELADLLRPHCWA